MTNDDTPNGGLMGSGLITLFLTRREAQRVRTACKAAFNRSRRMFAKAPDFIPQPGRFDANRSNMIAMARVIYRIDDALGTPHDRDFASPDGGDET